MTVARQVVVGQPTKGIRFLPGAVKQWLGISPKELVDCIVDAQDISALKSVRHLHDILPLAIGTETNIIVQRARKKLQTSSIKIETIASELHISPRHLRRLFIDEVGLSPVLFSRICRFQRFLSQLNTVSTSKLSHMAYEVGYTDQAHMNRDVKQLSGITPIQLKNHMSDLFNTEIVYAD